jgi:hypothetical protein
MTGCQAEHVASPGVFRPKNILFALEKFCSVKPKKRRYCSTVASTALVPSQPHRITLSKTLPPILSPQALEYMFIVESIQLDSTTWETKLADFRVLIQAAAADNLISVREWRALVVRASRVNTLDNSY